MNLVLQSQLDPSRAARGASSNLRPYLNVFQMSTELASSSGFRLWHDYEVVWLETARTQVVAGDHYGDPAYGLIDEANGWCASFGEGAICYWLQEPFRAYQRGEASEQWCEWGRENVPCFVTRVRQVGPFEVEVVSDRGGVRACHVLKFCASERRIVEVQGASGNAPSSRP